jgi:hypothetical protein
LDHRTYLEWKHKGDKSMYEKRWCSEGVEEQVAQDPHAMVKADCGASLIPRRIISGPIERTPDLDVSLYLDFTQRLSVPSTGKASSNELR